jgi:hypothetical protein
VSVLPQLRRHACDTRLTNSIGPTAVVVNCFSSFPYVFHFISFHCFFSLFVFFLFFTPPRHKFRPYSNFPGARFQSIARTFSTGQYLHLHPFTFTTSASAIIIILPSRLTGFHSGLYVLFAGARETLLYFLSTFILCINIYFWLLRSVPIPVSVDDVIRQYRCVVDKIVTRFYFA